MDLRPVVMTTFVLLEAEWPVSKGRELLKVLDPTHSIIHQSDTQEELYYLYPVQETFDTLERAVFASSIEEGFHLQTANATPVVDIHMDALKAPDQCIVQEEGQLIGFLDASISPSAVRFPGDEEDWREQELRTNNSIIAEFPEQAGLGETTSLLVSLSTSGGIEHSSVETLPIGTTVDIIVQARHGFVLEGRGEGSLMVSEAQETLPLQFKLRSTGLGRGQIRILAFHDGIALGKLTLTPTVIARSTSTSHDPSSSSVQSLAPVSVQLPDLSLLIEESWVNGRRAFTVRLTASDPYHGLNLAKFGPILFQSDPGPYFQGFYEDIESYTFATATDRSIAAHKLAAKGEFLFSTLLPSEVQSKLWSLKDQITSVLVQSEEPWIPWELCKLCGNENGQVIAGPFFCEAFAITRWMPGLGFKPHLTLHNMAVVVPSNSQLPYAFSELDYFLMLAQKGNRVARHPARFLDLHRAFASGEYDGWHFTGHGLYRDDDPNRSAIYLEDGETFTPEQLVGVVANLGRVHPLVFLNACQVGRSAMSLTGIGGWAKQFLFAGAGAFIGSYWSVYDQSACNFAQAVYNRLFAGSPIGNAVREARLVIRSSGDPTWLAYTIFADPFATVVRESPC